jgi:hypothetical protein
VEQTKQEVVEELSELSTDLWDCLSRARDFGARAQRDNDPRFTLHITTRLEDAIRLLNVFISELDDESSINFKYVCPSCDKRWGSRDEADRCAASHEG